MKGLVGSMLAVLLSAQFATADMKHEYITATEKIQQKLEPASSSEKQKKYPIQMTPESHFGWIDNHPFGLSENDVIYLCADSTCVYDFGADGMGPGDFIKKNDNSYRIGNGFDKDKLSLYENIMRFNAARIGNSDVALYAFNKEHLK